jgi:hypothetical protein
MRYILSLCLALAVPWPAQAELIDLAPPFPKGSEPFAPLNFLPQDRCVVFDAIDTFRIDLAGIWIDPIGSDSIKVSIRQVTPQVFPFVGVGTRGPILASNTAPVTDSVMSLQSVPIDFTFIGGNRYDIAFESTRPEGWFDLMQFYSFHFPLDPPFIASGLARVIDGGTFPIAGYGSDLMPHVAIGVIPEPSAIILAVMAAGLLGLYRLRIRK